MVSRNYILYVLLLVGVFSACNKILYLNDDLRKSKGRIALLRGGPRVIINVIDSMETNESIGSRNIDWSDGHFQLSFEHGKCYAISPGYHNIKVTYSGLYCHTNPPYSYYKITSSGLIGPFYRLSPQPLSIDMISSETKSVSTEFLPNHKYEARVYLTFSPHKHSFRPDIPKYIAPMDTSIIIDPVLSSHPIIRVNNLCISSFDWNACIVDLGEMDDTCGESHASQIHEALNRKRNDYAMLLLSTYGKNEQKQIQEITSLHKASRSGNLALLEALLERNFDVNARSAVGMRPLHLAAENGHAEIVNMLVAAGAKINAKNDMGATPLFYASGNGHTRSVELLLAGGADVNAKQKNNWTPLHLACQGGHDEVVRLLIANGAKLNERSDIGLTPLIVAVNEHHLSTMTVLLEAGADADRRDKEGWSPLHYTALNGMSDAVAALLSAGALPCLPNKRLCTPLHSASLKGDTASVRMLIEAGCNVNAQTRNGWTPLHMAAVGASVDAVNLLLAQGADVNARTDDGETPLFLARQKRSVFCVATLMSHGAVE